MNVNSQKRCQQRLDRRPSTPAAQTQLVNQRMSVSPPSKPNATGATQWLSNSLSGFHGFGVYNSELETMSLYH